MGSSSKKKREKKKDFQKPKLKVGKARPKAANQTDTSFRSKAIVLSQQSLNVTAPSASSQFSHHVSLLGSRSDSQRRDSLAYLTTSIASRPVDTPLPLPAATLLPKLCPLVLDASSGVRSQLLKALQTLPESEVSDHASEILPYIRAGMTHLAADIRISAISVLSWLTKVAGEEVVSCPGGWYKTLNCFMTALGWHASESSKWSLNKTTFAKAGLEGKPMARNMQVLAEFLETGISASGTRKYEDDPAQPTSTFPLWHGKRHALPEKSNAYGYLNLFGMPKDEENAMLENREDRQRIFDGHFRGLIEQNLAAAMQEGGEVGRAAAFVTKALRYSIPQEDLREP